MPRLLVFVAIVSIAVISHAKEGQTLWRLDNLESIAGHNLHVEGSPKIIETDHGKALEFDGIDDGIFFDIDPLQGLSAFTVEVVFNPYKGGPAEQRFFHMQENGSDSRVMFETRLVEDDLWFLDTFILSTNQKHALYAENQRDTVDIWYHAAIVIDENDFKQYLDGNLQLEVPFDYTPHGAGKTSLGVRMNKVGWFKGAIRTVRITPHPLKPQEFLTASD